MIDHITFGVSNFDRSQGFYDKALAPLGMARLVALDPEDTDGVRVVGYGASAPCLWIAGERPARGLMHIALRAETPGAVDAFHAAARAAGGFCNGAPGLRTQYHAGYYAAYVRDPDGHNIEAVCHQPG